MSSQAAVHSIEALKDFRVALALYGEDTLAALGAIEAEVRRTVNWLQQERPYYWQEQIKRRREQVSLARAEVFRRQLQKRPDHTPAMSEQKENLRRAEASLQDAEKRLTLVRKWQPILQHAVLEYHASRQRLKDLTATDVPMAVNLLTRIIDALEAYLRIAPPPGAGAFAGVGAVDPAASMAVARAPAELESIAAKILGEPQPAATAQPSISTAGPAAVEATPCLETSESPSQPGGPTGEDDPPG
jgi:hypothetical protein